MTPAERDRLRAQGVPVPRTRLDGWTPVGDRYARPGGESAVVGRRRVVAILILTGLVGMFALAGVLLAVGVVFIGPETVGAILGLGALGALIAGGRP